MCCICIFCWNKCQVKIKRFTLLIWVIVPWMGRILKIIFSMVEKGELFVNG